MLLIAAISRIADQNHISVNIAEPQLAAQYTAISRTKISVFLGGPSLSNLLIFFFSFLGFFGLFITWERYRHDVMIMMVTLEMTGKIGKAGKLT